VGGREGRVAGDPSGLYRMRANVNREGIPLVRCKLLPAHAEVERVEVEDDEIVITGTIAPRDGELKLVAESRRDGTERTWPVETSDGAFATRIANGDLVRTGDAEVWDLRLTAGDEALRLGGHFDGILNKSAVIRYPARPAIVGETARRLRPYYTKRNRLSLRSMPISVAEARRKPPPPRAREEGPPPDKTPDVGLRRRLELTAMTIAQRIASGLLRLAIGRRRRAAKAPRDARKIYVLLMNAYGMGGTIRTTLNLVEELAETHEVELISVMRRRERPLFPFP
jgi:hypothetical protein